jgi:hypothetical protein
MIGVEDNLEGGEDNKSGGSRKPQKNKRRMGDLDDVGSLRNMMMAEESQRYMITEVEDMKVGDPVKVTRAGLSNGGESERMQFRSRLYGLKILQDKNVLYDSLLL